MPYSQIQDNEYPVFHSYFSSLTDPRRINRGNFDYPLEEILFLVIAAVISGANGWTAIETFGVDKLDWLRKYYPYENGTPSDDVLGKLFSRLDSKEFSECFSRWINSIVELTEGEVVAIDGKSIRGSRDLSAGKSMLHVVSAFAAKNRLCLGQEVVGQKSNEITAIPMLLDLLEIKGCIVTIDAMGCQKKIAEKIIKKKADYLLMVKGNQPELKQQVEKVFQIEKPISSDIMTDIGHGRSEIRTCETIDNLQFLDGKEEWKNLKTIVKITSERYNKQTEFSSTEVRYYISSMISESSKINKAVRSHWAIENNLHWNLDVVFNEDDSLKKKGNSASNFNIILKMALSMLENEKTKMSKPNKRLKSALSDPYREKVLQF